MSRLEQQQKEAVQFSASFVTSLFVYHLKTLIKTANRPLGIHQIRLEIWLEPGLIYFRKTQGSENPGCFKKPNLGGFLGFYRVLGFLDMQHQRLYK